MASQFELLRTRRFAPFFAVQALGALTDNLYRSAVMILVVFGGGSVAAAAGDVGEAGSGAVLANLAAALFIAPFFVFSATAGQIADKYDKAQLIRHIKLAEVVIALMAAVALHVGNTAGMLAVLFLLGTQSAFFGPVKYAILPVHLREEELVGGNAHVETGTFLAILIGTIAGGILASRGDAAWTLSLALLLLAGLGYAASRAVPPAPAAAPALTIDWNPWRQTWRVIGIARTRRSVFLAILGTSWFWLLGSAYLTQLPAYTRDEVFGDTSLVTLLMCCFSIGIGAGSLACERLSFGRIEIGLVPLGALGMTLFGFDLALIEFPMRSVAGSALEMATTPAGANLLIDLIGLGFSGGIFIVPLYAMIQQRSPSEVRAQIIAVNNIINALFMAVAALFSIVMLSLVELTNAQLFLTLTVMNVAVSVFIFQQAPEFAARFLIYLLSHTMYRVRSHGLEQIPERGAAIIVCNHVSYVDALLLGGAVKRPIRFVMYKPIYEMPVLHFIFRLGRAIPIAGRREDPAGYEQAFAAIRDGIAAGDLLCIFPEGKLTTDGQIDIFRSGIERIVAESPATVLPMALRGLWGSFFSHKGGPALTTPPRRFWSRVEIVAGAPVPPEQVSAEDLRQRVAALRGEFA